MKKQNYFQFIGIDVSKLTFDIGIIDELNHQESYCFENTTKGIRSFFQLLRKRKISFESTFICMEHTGIYGCLILKLLVEKEAHLCVEMPLKIQKSLGLQRGKSDKIDALRIAKYARKNYEELEIYIPNIRVLDNLKALVNVRRQLVKSQLDLKKYPNELKSFDKEIYKLVEKNTRKTLKTLEQEIKRIDKEIDQLILSDENLKSHMKLVTSVTGVGKITAVYLCVFTNMFNRYQTPKQLACYCGIAPFEYSSGTSIRRRSKVHYIANKTLKKHLHLCALAAIRYDPEINKYYNRKLEEGKSKMLIINNVRNKLVQRICAVIKRQEPYVKIIA